MADSSARRTIGTIAARGPMTVSELVDALGVTTTAVRQQVDRLSKDGWLIRTRRPGRTGRPADVFTVSEKGEHLFAGLSDEFTRILVAELSNRLDATKSRELFEAVGRRITDGLRDNVGRGSAPQRMGRLVQLLAERGNLAEAASTPKGLRLKLHRCPYGVLSRGHGEFCEMERQAFGELVGEFATLDKSRSKGHDCCEFAFAPANDHDASMPGTRQEINP